MATATTRSTTETTKPNSQVKKVLQDPITEPTSHVKQVLDDARKDLDNAKFILGFIANPFRDLLIKPALGLATEILPKVSSAGVPLADEIIAFGLSVPFDAMRFGYSVIHGFHERDVLKVRERIGNMTMEAGLYSSIATSILTDMGQFQRWKPGVEALSAYLKTSGIETELSPSLNERLLDNVEIIGKIQEEALAGGDRRDAVLSRTITWDDVPSFDEAKRYMRYATAAYGDHVISGTDFVAKGSIDVRTGELTTKRISEHVGIPEKDLVLIDLEWTGEAHYLRHFVAVDHENCKVVLTIRGTFSISNVLTDVSGVTRPFCGGEAHGGIATLTEQLWDKVGDTVLAQLAKYEDYELILTGHSLGAGSSCLLNILLHEDERKRVFGRPVRCFAFASPPVFTPLHLVPEAVESAVNYIHEHDAVPFLSGYSVRHLFASIAILEEITKDTDTSFRVDVKNGSKRISNSVAKAVLQANQHLPPKAGVPPLCIPVTASVWMCGKKESRYDAKLCDSEQLGRDGIYLDPDRFPDHLPGRYEYALNNIEIQKAD